MATANWPGTGHAIPILATTYVNQQDAKRTRE